MNEQCPVHGVPFKWVPPGTSKKTGQPYQGFWSCSTMGCKQKPHGDTPAPNAAPRVATEVKSDEPNWDVIGQQKNRSNLVAAALQSGKPLDYKELEKAEKWVLFGTQKPKQEDIWTGGISATSNEINVDAIPF